MKIVVTGATGFIATGLLQRLTSDQTTEIIAVSRRPLAVAGNERSIIVDLSAKGWTSALPVTADVVIHLAQSLRYKEFPEGGPDMVGINIDSTTELLEWSRRHGVSRFVLASSGSVYSPSDDLHRETDLCKPSDLYSATKLAAEQIALCYADLFQVVIARVFSVYGPSQQRGLFRTILNRIQVGDPVAVAGGRGPMLTPLFIDDAADIFARLATEEVDFKSTIVNVAGGGRYDLHEIAETMARIGGWTPRFDETPGSAWSLAANTMALRSLIPACRFTTIEDGIQRMIAEKPSAQHMQGSSGSPIHQGAQ